MERQTGPLAGTMTRTAEISAFLSQTDWADVPFELVAGDASNRKYLRLTRPEGSTAILMDAPPSKGEDVHPFVQIAQYLNDIGLSAPQIYAQDTDQGFLIIEDLGDALFADLMAADPDLERPLYRASIDALLRLHAADPLDLPTCDPAWIERMNALIFDWYAVGTDAEAIQSFHDSFKPLAKQVDAEEKVVILRDYHAQNLLWLPHREGAAAVGQLDFQDALLGHPAYDLVSILQDARRDVKPTVEAEMIDYYLKQSDRPRDAFLAAYAILGAQRNLCILGIFVRLCKRDGKPHYVDLIPRVWDYVLRDLAHPVLAPVAEVLRPALPYPSPSFLKELKAACPTSPS